ncbi:MAG: hypothetical protein V4749_05540 [Pseudomonadota bacterium]
MFEELLVMLDKEVLSAGPESTVPINLSDKWLDLMVAQMEDYFDHDIEAALSVPLAAVVHILFAKNGGVPVTESQDQLFEHLCRYRIELGFEEIRRKTGMDIEPASLQTILSSRVVAVESFEA